MRILGIRIDPVTKKIAQEKLREFLFDDRQHMLATPNPEIVVMGFKNKKFGALLNKSDLNPPDGYGLTLAAKFLNEKLPERVTGVDLVTMLAELATKNNKAIYLLGGLPDAAKKSAENLKIKFPNLKIYFNEGGKIERVGDSWQMNESILEDIKILAPEILIVALGHGKQEFWIDDHLQKLPSVKIAIGVGGALDYHSGKTKRAPSLIRRFGLEWLWRLILEPWRIKRIVTALIVFPWLVLKEKVNPYK